MAISKIEPKLAESPQNPSDPKQPTSQLVSIDKVFKTLGLLVALYVGYSLLSGTVYAKSGISGRSYSRRESPTSFWTTIVCYALLSAALILVF